MYAQHGAVTPLTNVLQGMITLGPGVSAAISFLIFGIFVVLVLVVFDYLFSWWERELVAKIHLRHGPTRVGKYGLLQNLADFVKLFSKGGMIPANANRYLFLFGLPMIAAILIFLVEILPFSPNIFGVDLSLGLLVAFVLLSFVPILILIAGWASGNRFASISSQGSVALLVSYEIPLLIIAAGITIISNGFSFLQIVNAQSNLWFVVLMPIGFAVFFIALLAELERPPFDLLESDSELIAGWPTDLDAPMYAMALFVDYTRVFIGSLLITILFLGGWLGPYLPQLAWLFIKVVLVATAIVIIRAMTPRMRLDRMLRLSWFYLIPLSIINLVLVCALFSGFL